MVNIWATALKSLFYSYLPICLLICVTDFLEASSAVLVQMIEDCLVEGGNFSGRCPGKTQGEISPKYRHSWILDFLYAQQQKWRLKDCSTDSRVLHHTVGITSFTLNSWMHIAQFYLLEPLFQETWQRRGLG